MQGIFQKENTDKALKYGIYRHLPTYEKIIRNLVSFYIKIVMILFIGTPLLIYLLGVNTSGIGNLCYIMPSVATFNGIMEIINGNVIIIKDIVILAVHCVVWFMIYIILDKKRKLSFSR